MRSVCLTAAARLLVLIAVLAGAIGTPGVAASAPSAWLSAPSLPSGFFSGAAVTGRDGRIYALGGITETGALSKAVEVYTPQTRTWTAVADMPIARRDLAATVGADGRIYAIGGRDAKHLDNTVAAYTPSTNTWAMLPPLEIPRSQLAAAAGPDGRIYAIGGYKMPYLAAPIEVYTPNTNSWSLLAPLPTPRFGLAVATGVDGRIYAMGGIASQGVVATVEAYTPATNSWSTVAPLPTARWGLAAVRGPDNRIYAIGGTGEGRHALQTVESYWPGNNSWTTVAPLQTARWSLAATAAPNGRIYVIGGAIDLDDPILDTVEAYAPLGPSPADPIRAACCGAQFFPPTGHSLGGAFLAFWQRYGGLDTFGYPRSEPFTVQGRTVQYTERFRLELVNGQVRTAPLGRQLTAGRVFPRLAPFTSSANRLYFAGTGHSLSGRFLAYWQSRHGQLLLGAPIAEVTHEQNDDGTGRSYTVQWFENGRIEYHPELAGAQYRVSLGLLGNQALAYQGLLP